MKTYTQKEFIDLLYKQVSDCTSRHILKKDVEIIYKEQIKLIRRLLLNGNDIKLKDLMTLSVKSFKARKTVNPRRDAKNKEMIIPERRVVRARISQTLQQQMKEMK